MWCNGDRSHVTVNVLMRLDDPVRGFAELAGYFNVAPCLHIMKSISVGTKEYCIVLLLVAMKMWKFIPFTPLLSSSDPSSSERPGQSASVHLERLENTALGHLPSHSLTSNPPTQQSQSNTRPQQALYLQREPSRGAESLLNFLGKLPFANKRAANPTCIQFRQRGSATPSCSSLSTCDYAPCASNPPEPHESERGGESATIGELEVIDTLSTITQRVSISEGTRGTVEDTSAQGLYAGSQPTSTFTLSKFHFPQPPRGAGIRPGLFSGEPTPPATPRGLSQLGNLPRLSFTSTTGSEEIGLVEYDNSSEFEETEPLIRMPSHRFHRLQDTLDLASQPNGATHDFPRDAIPPPRRLYSDAELAHRNIVRREPSPAIAERSSSAPSAHTSHAVQEQTPPALDGHGSHSTPADLTVPTTSTEGPPGSTSSAQTQTPPARTIRPRIPRHLSTAHPDLTALPAPLNIRRETPSIPQVGLSAVHFNAVRNYDPNLQSGFLRVPPNTPVRNSSPNSQPGLLRLPPNSPVPGPAGTRLSIASGSGSSGVGSDTSERSDPFDITISDSEHDLSSGSTSRAHSRQHCPQPSPLNTDRATQDETQISPQEPYPTQTLAELPHSTHRPLEASDTETTLSEFIGQYNSDATPPATQTLTRRSTNPYRSNSLRSSRTSTILASNNPYATAVPAPSPPSPAAEASRNAPRRGPTSSPSPAAAAPISPLTPLTRSPSFLTTTHDTPSSLASYGDTNRLFGIVPEAPLQPIREASERTMAENVARLRAMASYFEAESSSSSSSSVGGGETSGSPAAQGPAGGGGGGTALRGGAGLVFGSRSSRELTVHNRPSLGSVDSGGRDLRSSSVYGEGETEEWETVGGTSGAVGGGRPSQSVGRTSASLVAWDEQAAGPLPPPPSFAYSPRSPSSGRTLSLPQTPWTPPRNRPGLRRSPGGREGYLYSASGQIAGYIYTPPGTLPLPATQPSPRGGAPRASRFGLGVFGRAAGEEREEGVELATLGGARRYGAPPSPGSTPRRPSRAHTAAGPGSVESPAPNGSQERLWRTGSSRRRSVRGGGVSVAMMAVLVLFFPLLALFGCGEMDDCVWRMTGGRVEGPTRGQKSVAVVVSVVLFVATVVTIAVAVGVLGRRAG
ncbi:hypothetical protein M8818_005316 [Zalaria obscura]|uniref:Uncharacterized protein n=1 Tax=Zalaria obscura TaxID=2024903 RepID=A0ACC3SB05_9PEZI